MSDLRKRFGRLVAAHRKRRGLTQEELAEAADVSPDTIAKIEIGVTGARFPVIQRLADALEIDPAELFSTEIPSGALMRGKFAGLSMRLATLSESELDWVGRLLDVALVGPSSERSGTKTPPSPSSRVTAQSRSKASGRRHRRT